MNFDDWLLVAFCSPWGGGGGGGGGGGKGLLGRLLWTLRLDTPSSSSFFDCKYSCPQHATKLVQILHNHTNLVFCRQINKEAPLGVVELD